VVHATASNKAYLQRVRDNLRQLEGLKDSRIPRVVSWRAAGGSALPDFDWALLVCSELPGETLSPRNYRPSVWVSLSDLLARLHAQTGEDELPAPVLRPEHPETFRTFAEILLLRLREFPISADRARSHLNRLAEYADGHASTFRVAPRMIHGDLDRRNVVVQEGGIGLLDWADLRPGDYAYDLGMAKFMLDSVAPKSSAALLRRHARACRERFEDLTLELRLRFFLALAGLVHAYQATDDTGAFWPARAWRVRASYLHSEAQWLTPLQLDGESVGAPAVRTEQWALDIQQPLRGLFYLMAPKKVA
jgi:Ser/Thr protein kinase RdoA (MazF antagonist)